MIHGLVDFALNNRFLILALALLLFIWGAISFHQLPVEAYPDVANNYVEVITQWPGISAEQIEQQVTIPIEIVMNGIPHLTALRSFSLFGLSDLKLTFDDESENDWNREKVLERLSQVTLPPGVQPQMGTDWSPVGQIYFFTLHSTNPKYDVMELKSIEDWVIEKQFKSVPNVVDVASFGGPTREYQVRVDPNKLISYGLSIGQVEQQLTNNNANAGGSFIEEGLQQINVREVGLVENMHDIENTVIMTKNGTPLRVSDIAIVAQGPKIRLGQFARAMHLPDGKIIDNDDVVSGIVLLRKGADSDSTLDGIHAKVKELNDRILPPGVKVVPFLDRSDLVHYTTHTVLHNLTRRHHSGGDHSVPVSGQRARRADRRADHSVFAAVRGDLSGAAAYSRESAVAGRAGFRHGGGRRGGDGGEHRPPSGSQRESERPERRWRRSARPRTRCSGRCFTRSASSSRPTCPIFTLQRVEGRLFKPMAWTVAFALLGALMFSMLLAPVLASFFFPKGTREWHNPLMTFLTRPLSRAAGCAIRWRWATLARRAGGVWLGGVSGD